MKFLGVFRRDRRRGFLPPARRPRSGRLSRRGGPWRSSEVGRRWAAKQGFLECSGLHNFLVADRTLAAGDFRIRARLSLEKLDDTAASLVINGNHFGFDGREQGKRKYHVEGPQFGGLRFLDSSPGAGDAFRVRGRPRGLDAHVPHRRPRGLPRPLCPERSGAVRAAAVAGDDAGVSSSRPRAISRGRRNCRPAATPSIWPRKTPCSSEPPNASRPFVSGDRGLSHVPHSRGGRDRQGHGAGPLRRPQDQRERHR